MTLVSSYNHYLISPISSNTSDSSTRSLFCSIILKWDYTKHKVCTSMPKYIPNALIQQKYPIPTKPQHLPHYFTTPKYCQKTQFTTIFSMLSPLTKDKNNFFQQTIGIYQWLAHVIDSTMLLVVGTIETNQTLLPYK